MRPGFILLLTLLSAAACSPFIGPVVQNGTSGPVTFLRRDAPHADKPITLAPCETFDVFVTDTYGFAKQTISVEMDGKIAHAWSTEDLARLKAEWKAEGRSTAWVVRPHGLILAAHQEIKACGLNADQVSRR